MKNSGTCSRRTIRYLNLPGLNPLNFFFPQNEFSRAYLSFWKLFSLDSCYPLTMGYFSCIWTFECSGQTTTYHKAQTHINRKLREKVIAFLFQVYRRCLDNTCVWRKLLGIKDDCKLDCSIRHRSSELLPSVRHGTHCQNTAWVQLHYSDSRYLRSNK